MLGYLKRHHWGLIATFIALGGTAYASGVLPANSVGTRQIRQGAVTLAKIAPGALASLAGGGELRDVYLVSSHTLLLQPQSLSVQVPRGSYLADGNCYGQLENTTNSQGVAFGFVEADLRSSEPQTSPNHVSESAVSSVPDAGIPAQPFHYSELPPYGSALVNVRGPVRLSHAGTITLRCSGSGPPHPVETVGNLVVIPVKTIHGECPTFCVDMSRKETHVQHNLN